jgi:hypothetical protein
MGSGVTSEIAITTANAVISCANVSGWLHIEAQGVTVKNSIVSHNSGKTGTAANGTAVITIDDGASATIDHVETNGLNGVHACVWHQGTAATINALNCHGINDGVFSWQDNTWSGHSTGDNFSLTNSWLHDFTSATANGHIDGYQTEGAVNGLIQHNTFQMTTSADSAIAMWDSLKSTANMTVQHNLITGGGFSVYAQDYNPGDGAPGDPTQVGGYSLTGVHYTNNVFSTSSSGSGCVGEWGVWFTRPSWSPYYGGPTDGWNATPGGSSRSGNTVLETGQSVDNGNPTSGGSLCS